MSSKIRLIAAWLAASASDGAGAPRLVLWFAAAHALLWTVILAKLKAAQDIHFDTAEAYAWGQKFQLGYGKHPPLSGWIAGVWFQLFPATNLAAYGLAMATIGVGLFVCWLVALRVVDRRRAFFVVVMLALYPIFNFKGFKYNPDLLQLVTLPLMVLAYLNAFDKKTARAGLWLGLAGALALMTKYWVLTMIGALGIAALLHPQRRAFLRSPAPWVAIVTLLVAMAPHLWWLREVDFAPLTYAGDVYALKDRAENLQLVLGYVEHNIGLLAAPVVLAALVLAWRHPLSPMRTWVRGPNSGVNYAQALNVWIAQIVVAIGPPLGALAFMVYLKTDWGISLFFLVPLALVALPWLRLPKIALVDLSVIWLVVTLATLVAAPYIEARTVADYPDSAAGYSAKSELARELTETWHQRFGARWAVVAALTDIGVEMTFYSPDHPQTYTPGEIWSSGLTSLEEAKRLGYIGIFDNKDDRLPAFDKWMAANAPNAETLLMTTRRFFNGHAGPSTTWKIYLVPPGK